MADSSDNPYIRTYAKDVAAAQGKAPLPVAAGAPAPVPSSTPVVTPEPAVDADRESVLARLRERAAKDPVHQSAMLPPTLPTPVPKAASIGDGTIPSVEPTPIPVPVSAPTPVVVVPPPVPPKPEPVAPPPPPPPPAPPVPEPTPLMPAAPIVLPPAPLPPPVQPAAGPSPIHTYKSDFADRIDSKEASTFSVLAAQSDAGPRATPQVASGKRAHHTGIVFAAAGIVLILIAGAGALYAYQYVQTHSTVALLPSVPSLIFADDRQALTGEGPQLVQAIAGSADTALPDGQVRVLYLTQASTTADGKTVTVPLAGGRLIGALQLSAPDILLRNVAPESTVGIVHSGPETRAFFIMKVLSYERTFAGMLQWEGTMQYALSALYPQYPEPEQPAPTVTVTTKIVKGKPVTSTTTIPAAPVVTYPPRFVDEVATNHDVRALKDSSGRTILLYGYKDKDTLIIARDEAAFAELLTRLAATKQQ